MIKILIKFISFALTLSLMESAKILGIFHYPSYSHQVVYQRLVKDLADRGHQLTILTADRMNSSHPNITEIYLHSSYEENINFVECRQFFFAQIIISILLAQFKRTERQLNQPEVQELIVNHKNYIFDLVILEYLLASPMLGFAELFDCPVIGISAISIGIPVHELLGNPINPSIFTEIILPAQHGRLKFVERFWSFWYYVVGSKIVYHTIVERIMTNQVKKYFVNFTGTMDDLEDRVDLVFVNTHPVLDYIRPITPNTVQLGFMHVEPPKPVVEGLRNVLDSAVHGVIYMSLGSNVKSKDLQPEVQQIFMNVFRSLPYEILWKFESDNISNVPSNVMISKWFPQSDLLAHPNVKLFITQGGLMSLEEAIDRETPMISIPFILDQNQNSLKIQEEGFGVKLELEDVTEKSLHDAIVEVMKPKYVTNIKKFKSLIYDQPMTSRDKAVWWTEHVIRHKGAKHLKFPGRRVPFYQRYCLELLIPLQLIIFLILRKIWRKLCEIVQEFLRIWNHRKISKKLCKEKCQ